VLLALPAAGHAHTSQTRAPAGRIAFLRWQAGAPIDFSVGPSLYVVRADGSALRRLTPQAESVYAYSWSPDGRLIAYIDAKTLSLWLVRPDGSGRRVLHPTSRLSTVALNWSPDSKNIAIVSPGSDANLQKASRWRVGLYVLPVSSGRPVPLPAGNRLRYDLAWSPRGDEIAYDNGGIWSIRPDGTGRRKITDVGGGPRWSADGTQLAFNVAIHRTGMSRLARDRYHTFAVVDADGSGYHLVTIHSYNEYGQAWSPSGRRILYGRQNHQGIYLIGSDGRNNHRVTSDSPPEAGWGALAWSPNGLSIVYDTGNIDDTGNGDTDLYLIGIDGRNKIQLTDTRDIDIAPSWVAG
jgi:Tol biopolymer transport system component